MNTFVLEQQQNKNIPLDLIPITMTVLVKVRNQIEKYQIKIL